MFQQDILGSFDLGLLGPESGLTTDVSYIQNVGGDIASSNVTQQQTWAERMAGDKKVIHTSISINALARSFTSLIFYNNVCYSGTNEIFR